VQGEHGEQVQGAPCKRRGPHLFSCSRSTSITRASGGFWSGQRRSHVTCGAPSRAPTRETSTCSVCQTASTMHAPRNHPAAGTRRAPAFEWLDM